METDKKSAAAARTIFRIGNALLWVMTTAVTIKEFGALFFGMVSGSPGSGFVSGIAVASAGLAMSIFFAKMAFVTSRQFDLIVYAYGVLLSLIVAAYYFAISSNYGKISSGLMHAFGWPSSPATPAEISLFNQHTLAVAVAIFCAFAVPLVGLIFFTRRIGPMVGGISGLILMGAFAWGSTDMLRRLLDSASLESGFGLGVQVFMLISLVGLGVPLMSGFASWARSS